MWSPFTHYAAPAEKADGTMPDDITGPDGSKNSWVTVSGAGVSWIAPRIAEIYQEKYFNGWKYSASPAYYRSGWPLKSMQSIISYCQDKDGQDLSRWELPKTEILRRGLQTNELPSCIHAEEDRRVPMMPIWTGFTVDSAMYFVLLECGRRIWRWLGRRRGGRNYFFARFAGLN